MIHRRLFIPGPTEVRSELLLALATPQIGHRFPEYSELHERVIKKLKKLLYTEQEVILSTSSGTGLMEAAVRNTVAKRAVNFCNGAFADRWHEICVENNIPADAFKIEWGKGVKPEMVDEALSTGKYDAVTICFNESSTGVMSPLEPIAEVMKKYPDVMFLVDAVSAMAGVKIEFDKLGIDILLASVQKCFGLPPGLAVCAMSKKAIEKAKSIKARGYYFDLIRMIKSNEKNQTPTTPVTPIIFALDKALDDMFEEGLDKRFERHKKMANAVRTWANKYFEMFPEPGFESDTVSCIKNTRGISVAGLNDKLKEYNVVISNGYKELKEKTFRIAHMGDIQIFEIYGLLKLLDEILGF